MPEYIINLKLFYVMKTKCFILFCLLLVMASCNENSPIDSQELSYGEELSVFTKSNRNTLFQNVESFTALNGDTWITGEIYCPNRVEYTFVFAFYGQVGGATYYVNLSSYKNFYPANGGSFRTEKIVLAPGTHYFSVGVFFSEPGQSGNARLMIDKINGQMITNEDGYVDLVAEGESQIHDPGGSEPFHWTCPACGMLNSIATSTCVACGHGD